MIDLFDSIEEVKQEESIQEDKQEATADASEEPKQEELDDFDEFDEFEEDGLENILISKYGLKLPKNIDDSVYNHIYYIVFSNNNLNFEENKTIIESLINRAIEEPKQEETIQEVKQVETIQENKQEDKEIEYNFKQYLKSIIAIQHLAIEESDDCLSFVFTIKKSDLSTFKQPKVYASYEHSQKIKQGQEEARKRGKKPGLKRGSTRERTDKQPLIEQIKKLSNSFYGSMNNHELAKALHCSLNRICNYKKEIKKQLKNSN